MGRGEGRLIVALLLGQAVAAIEADRQLIYSLPCMMVEGPEEVEGSEPGRGAGIVRVTTGRCPRFPECLMKGQPLGVVEARGRVDTEQSKGPAVEGRALV